MKHLALLLLLASGPAAAEWTRVAGDAATTTYADPASIVRAGDTAKMLWLVDYKSFQRMVEVGYFSQKSLAEYDCAGARARGLSVALHAGNMGEGKVIYADDTPHRWEAVSPSTLTETLLKTACK